MKNNLFNKNLQDIQKRALIGRTALEAQGMVRAWPLFSWIEKEWLEKALGERVLRYHSEEYGYIILVDTRQDEKVVGYKGRTPITEIKENVTDSSRFKDFHRRYEEYRQKKEKQQFAINEQMKSLLESDS